MGSCSLVSLSNNNPLSFFFTPFLLRPSKHFICNVPFKPPVPAKAGDGVYVKGFQQLLSSLQTERVIASPN